MRPAVAMLMGLVVAGVLIAAANAAERMPYRAGDFAKAEAQNKPILVHVTASWCPTCHAQNAVIEHALLKHDFANFVVFDVDYDSQKDAVRTFDATTQSTLVFFRGKTEVARSIGDTDPSSIESFMRRAEN